MSFPLSIRHFVMLVLQSNFGAFMNSYSRGHGYSVCLVMLLLVAYIFPFLTEAEEDRVTK